MIPHPRVVVIPSVEAPAVSFLAFDAPSPGRVVPVDEAFNARYHTDACYMLHAAPDDTLAHRWLDDMRRCAGADPLARELFTRLITTQLVSADLDILPHGEIPAHSDAGRAYLADAIPADLPPWVGHYLTPYGARLFGYLPEPVPVQYAESAQAIWFALLRDHGIRGVDETLGKWCRVTRLPHIRRPDVGYTDPGPITFPTAYAPIPLGALASTALGTGSPGRAVDAGDAPHVADDYAPLIPEALEPYREILEGRVRFAAPGGRHQAYGGLIAAITNRLPGVDAEHLFRLTILAIRAAEYPEGEAWAQCAHRIATHAPMPPTDPDPFGLVDPAAEETIRQAPSLLLYITADPDRVWVWDPRLSAYNSTPVAVKALPEILRVWWDGLGIDLSKASDKGPVRLTGAELRARYGLGVGEVAVGYTAPDAPLIQTGGTWAARLAFVRPRADLVPREHRDVDAWLWALDPSGALRGWLAWALELGERLPALALVGAAGVGKSLLAESLAAVWGSAAVGWDTVQSGSASALLTQPIIFRDEAPAGACGSDTFRRLVGATKLEIREKYRPTVVLYGSPRVIIASNEPTVLQFRKEQLSGASADAVRQRILAVAVSAAAAEYLESLGGPAGFQHWIATPSSPGAIVEHIAWLHACARPPRATSRFAVDPQNVSTARLVATSSGARELLQGLCEIVDRYPSIPDFPQGFDVGTLAGRGDDLDPESPHPVLWVAASALKREWKAANLHGEAPIDSLRMVSLTAKDGTGRWSQASRAIRSHGRIHRAWPVRLDLLLLTADEAGLSAGPLETLNHEIDV